MTATQTDETVETPQVPDPADIADPAFLEGVPLDGMTVNQARARLASLTQFIAAIDGQRAQAEREIVFLRGWITGLLSLRPEPATDEPA
jgi:hypothetical protein